MRTARIHEGDLVEVNVRGTIFDAHVADVAPRDWAPGFVEIDPVRAGYGYHFVRAREIRKVLERRASGGRAAA